MKYINPVNFVLAIAALAFSAYVFSMTFMSSPPAQELALQETPGTVGSGAPSSEAAPLGRMGNEEGSGEISPPNPAQPNLSGQQDPSRNRRTIPPASARPPGRSGGRRPARPGTQPSELGLPSGLTPEQRQQAMPQGAVIPDGIPERPPARQRPTPPPSVGSRQDQRPLPLRDRGNIKREPDPDAPPPTRGSRQQ